MQHPFLTIHPHLNLTATSPSPSPSPPPFRAHKMGIHTAFYWGKPHQILFPGWPGSSPVMYAVAMLFVIFLAILVECLAHLQLVKPGSHRVASCFFGAGMLAVRAVIAYMVILAVMSYSAEIFIAAIVGHAVGYVLFGSGLVFKLKGPSNVGFGHCSNL